MYHSPWLLLVPVTGLEPVRCRQRRILSPLRLPFHHTGRCVHSIVLHHSGYTDRAARVPVSGCGARNFLLTLLAKFRPLPIARVASSASGGAPLALQALTGPPSLAADFESTTSTFFSHRQVLRYYTPSFPKKQAQKHTTVRQNCPKSMIPHKFLGSGVETLRPKRHKTAV